MLSNPIHPDPLEPTVKIALGNGLYAIIDEDDFNLVSQYTWHAEQFKCSFYAVATVQSNGRTKKIRMHRLIAKTPPGKVTHHLNHNTLDNRRKNLVNMTPSEHMLFHSNNNIRIKYAV